MAMETIHSQIAEAGAQEVARHQAGVTYITELAQRWSAGMIEAFGLEDVPVEEVGTELYSRTEGALSAIDRDATVWIPAPHSYSRNADGGWAPDTMHAALVQLGWATCEQLPRTQSERAVKPSYRLKPTPTGRELIDEWRKARGEVDSATQIEINRQKYREWLESIRARRSPEA